MNAGADRDTQASTEDLLLAAAYLSRVAEPASMPVWLLVREHGYLAAAQAIRSGDVPAEVAACTEARRSTADPHGDLQAAARNDIRLITPSDKDWPHFAFAALQAAALRRSAQWLAGYRSRPGRGELIPPLALWVRGSGELRAVGTRSVAVVGSRAATSYGEQLAADFCYGLARKGSRWSPAARTESMRQHTGVHSPRTERRSWSRRAASIGRTPLATGCSTTVAPSADC